MIPKLRFKADDGSEFPEWKEENVGNLTTELEYYDKLSSGYPLLTSSRAGIMLQSDFRDKITTDNDAAMFSVVPYGKCTYRHMSDDDIFHFNINDIAENGLVSQEYPVFDTINGNSLYLLVEYLNSNRRFRKFCREMKKGGTRTRLYYKYLCEFQLLFPSLPEQKKIADFLSTIDEIITTTEAELTAWQERKKGVMQKIFNREVRFKADDGSEFPEWEEKRLGEVFVERSERSTDNLDLLSVTIANGVIRQNESDKRNVSSVDKSNYKRVYVGDLAYNSMRMWQGAEGVSAYDGIVSPAYTVLVPKKQEYAYFYEYMFKRTEMLHVFQRYSQGLTSDTWNLKYPVLAHISVVVPSFPEQQKIADCLSSLDDAINQIKAELSAWKEFKKGLLQQMFV